MMINIYGASIIVLFYLLWAEILANTEAVRIEGTSSFANQQKSERVFNMYKKSPLSNDFAFSNIFDGKENTENVEHKPDSDSTNEKDSFRMNPFFTQYQYTYSSPRHPSSVIRAPNDVLVIVTNPPDGNCTVKNSSTNNRVESSKIMYGGFNRYSKSSPPSKCVWAIVACCAPTSQYFRYSCFDFMECTGAFWYFNPCQLPAIIASAEEALKYYQQFLPSPKPTTEVNTNNVTTTVIPTIATNETTTQTNEEKTTAGLAGEST